MELSAEKKDKFDKILKDKGIDDAQKKGMESKELVELKSYAIVQKLKKQRYVRN